MVTRVEGHDYAVLVDSLEDIVPCTAEPLGALASADPRWRAVGTGVVERPEGPALVIDLHALVAGIAVTP